MTGRPRNDHLSTLLDLVGWSQGETARRVNARARDLGHRGIAVDTARVGRWIGGERPRPPVDQVLAEILGECLAMSLDPADLGLSEPTGDPLAPGWNPATMVESLQAVTGSDLMFKRRDLLHGVAGASLAATVGRLWNGTPQPVIGADPGSAGGTDWLGTDNLDRLEVLIGHWRAADDAHGGALFRDAVVAQLRAVSHGLGDRPATPLTTRLFAVVADLAGLAGWMSHDTARFAAAQRYWAFGLMAARRAGQPGRGAELISRMAHQRVFFGHPADALALLDVADRVAHKGDSDLDPDHRLQAMLTAQRGRMLAGTGDARTARYLLTRAGDLLATAEQHREPAADWISYFTTAELAGATAVSRRDLRELHDKDIGPASTAFADAVQLRGPGYDRCQAMDRVGHVAALLSEGQPEQACSVGHRALHAAAGLDSTLIRSRILTVTDAAGPFQRHPDVLELRERTCGMAMAGAIPAA